MWEINESDTKVFLRYEISVTKRSRKLFDLALFIRLALFIDKHVFAYK